MSTVVSMSKVITRIETQLRSTRMDLIVVLDGAVRHIAELEQQVAALRHDVDNIMRGYNGDPR